MRHLAKILCLVAFVSAAGCDADVPAPAKKPPPVVEPLPDRKPEPPPVPALHTWQDCQGSDQAWVRQSLLLLAGRRSAWLWRPCGGSKLGFLLNRRKLREEAKRLLQTLA